MRVAVTFEEAREARSGRVGLVPTMGYLHEGHLALAAAAAGSSDTVIMSLFVNPLQFDDELDLAVYPRDPERDAGLAAAAGVDVLFAPPVDEMYPEPSATRVAVAGLSTGLEGACRPGHFDGVATVVTKLFAGAGPDAAFFGRKDAQQLAVVRRLCVDLSFPIEVVGVPTVREEDGLALSSRNVRLEPGSRSGALGLSRGLFAAADAIAAGERSARALEQMVRTAVAEVGGDLDYVTLADATTAQPIPELDRPAFLAGAAFVGGVRLIDNIFLWPDRDPDLGIRLEGPSILYEGGT